MREHQIQLARRGFQPPRAPETLTRGSSALLACVWQRKRLDAILQQRRRQDAEAPLIAFSDEKTAKRFGKYFPGTASLPSSSGGGSIQGFPRLKKV
eukprot:2054716-Rhodomonas_salina.5